MVRPMEQAQATYDKSARKVRKPSRRYAAQHFSNEAKKLLFSFKTQGVAIATPA